MVAAILVPFDVLSQSCTNAEEYTVVNETDCDLYVTVSYGDLNMPGCGINTVSFVVNANDDHTETTTGLSWDFFVDAVVVQLWNGVTPYGNPYGAQYQCQHAETDDLQNCGGSRICAHFNSDCTAVRVEPSACP